MKDFVPTFGPNPRQPAHNDPHPGQPAREYPEQPARDYPEQPARDYPEQPAPGYPVQPTPGEDQGTQWMLAFQAGDEGAFEHIVSRYQSSVFHFILRTVGDRGRAEDLTQELFVRLYRSRRRYQPQAKFRTYLFTIASRLSSNELRARRRWRRVFVNPFRLQADMDEAPAGAEDGLVCLPGREETPAARLETQELEGVIHGLLAGLTPNQRAAIQLQQSETFSYREIAGILGVSTPAVKSLLVRAREKLRLGVESYLRGDRRSAPRAEGEKLAEDGSTRAETPGGENES